MLKKTLLLSLVLTILTPFGVLAQEVVSATPPADPQISEQKILKIPSSQDDLATERLLKEMTKRSGWFKDIKIRVNHGIVIIKGKALEAKHVKWLSKTAEKLPTVIAVVDRVEVMTPAIGDMTPFYKELKRLQDMAKKHIPIFVVGLTLSLFFIFLGLRIQNWMKLLWERRIPNAFLASTVARLSMLPLWVMFFYLTLLTVGLQSLATTIIGGTGVLGIVLGFAFKGIAENYLSGLLLAIRSPFTKGDHIKVDPYEGLVQNLDMRGTTIMDFDGNLILIPNTTVIQSVVKNLSTNPHKRSSFNLGIGYNESVTNCIDIIQATLKTIPGIKQDPLPLVFADSLGTSAINIRVFFFFNAQENSEALLKSTAVSKVKDALITNGISIPDEAREVVFADSLKIQMLQETDALNEKKRSDDLKSKAENHFNQTDSTPSPDSDHEKELLKVAERSSPLLQKDQDNLLKM